MNDSSTASEYENLHRPDGIICSYPKTGRTWLRFMLAEYFNRIFHIFETVTTQNFYQLIPNLDTNVHGRGARDRMHFDGPLVGMIHASGPKGHIGSPVVVLMRLAEDTLVSHWIHTTHHYATSVGDLSEFIRGPMGISAYIEYIDSWKEDIALEHVLPVKYESFMADPYKNLETLLLYFAVPIYPATAASAIQSASFPNMQKIEQAYGLKGIDYDRTNPEALRVRRGRVGDYSTYMNKNDQQYVSDQLDACEFYRSVYPRTYMESHK